MNDYNIIVAAGTGSRFGAGMPKQFCSLGGRPLLMTTIERLRFADPSAEIILVLSESMIPLWLDMCTAAGFTSPEIIAKGGSSRAESVRSALRLIDAATTGRIGVHDGARPVVEKKVIERLSEAIADGADGAIPATAVTDSLRRIFPDGTSEATDRSQFRAVQTPQFFNGAKLLQAYREHFSPTATDDASLMETAGFTDLRLVEGSPRNIKVTNPGDMEIAALYLKIKE